MPHHGQVHVDRAALSSAFVQLPMDVLDDPDLDPQDVVLLARLIWYSFRERNFPGIEALSRDLRRSRSATQRTCRKLERLGWLRLSQRGPGATLRVDIPDPQRKLPAVAYTLPHRSTDDTPGVASTLPLGSRPGYPSQDSGGDTERRLECARLIAEGMDAPAAARQAYGITSTAQPREGDPHEAAPPTPTAGPAAAL